MRPHARPSWGANSDTTRRAFGLGPTTCDGVREGGTGDARRRSARWAALVVALGLSSPLAACAARGGPAPSARADAPADDDGALEAETTRPSLGTPDRTVEQVTRRILEGVSQARGLPIRGNFTVGRATKAELREFVRGELYREIDAQEFRRLARVEVALGVLPPGADPEAVLLNLFDEGLMGLYDPRQKLFVVGDYVPRLMLDMVVGHEIVHALQDMHFDLQALSAPLRGESDREAARTFLIEGDAQAAFYAWRSGLDGLRGVPDSVLESLADEALDIDTSMTPYPALARMLQMPYTDGAATVVALARAEGWEGVNRRFSELPTTTEQMLHLDKLLAREPARRIDLPAGAFEGVVPAHALVHTDALGEATLLALLVDVAPVAQSRQAAEGWGGDRFVMLETSPPGPIPILAGVIAWDSEADAQQAEGPLRKLLAVRTPTGGRLERRGAAMAYVIGASTHTDALMQALWTNAQLDGQPLPGPSGKAKPKTKAKSKSAARSTRPRAEGDAIGVFRDEAGAL